ncbi:MAG: HAD domain-containing protein [Armatimonadota bacterium]
MHNFFMFRSPRLFVLVMLLLVGIANLPARAGEPVTWQRGPSTREAENGTILVNDLNYVPGNGQPRAEGYPQAPVVLWKPIPANAPGRFRVSVRARTEKLGPSSLVLQAWVRQEDGGVAHHTGTHVGWIPVTITSLSLSGYKFNAPGQWQDFTLEFPVEAGNKPVTVGLLYVGSNQPCAAGKVQVETASLRLEKLNEDITVSWARPVKLRYTHREAGQVELRLTNATDVPQQVQVRPVIVTDTDARTPGIPKAFTVPATSTIAGTAPFRVPAADGGYGVVVELLRDGKVLRAYDADLFAATDSPFQCMTQGPLHFAGVLTHAWVLSLKDYQEKVLNNWDAIVKEATAGVESYRRSYGTYAEFFAWAREDATWLVEESDEPYRGGQVFVPFSRKTLQLCTSLMKAQGMAPVAYVNAIPFGWPGFEVFRRHPEWFSMSPNGQPGAYFDTSVMEKYLNGEFVQGNVYPCIGANYDAVSPSTGQTYLQYHTDQLVRSAKLYGWEAYRYDAGPLPVEKFPIVKARLAKQKPPVAVGNNLGIIVLGSVPSDQWRSYCQDESLMMEEVTSFAFHSATDPHRRWTDWIEFVRKSSHLTRSHGGHYTQINMYGNWLSTAISYACGGHPWGFHKGPFGDSERFMLRYGFIFWDLRTQMFPEPEKVASVTSERPLWWKPLVSQRVLSATHRQMVFPLFNPPKEEQVIGVTPVGPVEGATLTFTPKPGEQVTAWLLAPEPVARRVALPMKTTPEGAVQVTVPQFWGWTNVLFDCEGK